MKARFSVVTMAIGLLSASHAIAAPEKLSPQVHLDAGQVSGASMERGGAMFKGIPFAAPPVGDLRWRSTQPVKPWKGTFKALDYGHTCPQTDEGYNKNEAAASAEDCLNLNVFTPKLGPGARYPVMVWLHGGSYTGGSGTNPGFAGDQFVANGVVLVSINYRLGALGFMAHPELSAESPTKTSGNYGIEDQIAALRWVKVNIAHFGGDPGNVTIFGQSAGGGSVTNLMSSSLTVDLIHKAIIQSGSTIRATKAPTLALAEQTGTRYAKGATIAQLRAMTPVQLLERTNAFAKEGPGNGMGPITDGRVETEDLPTLFARHGEQKIPLIIGNNAREGMGQITAEDLPAAIARAYGANADSAVRLYGIAGGATPPPDPVLGGPGPQFLTDTTFRCGAVITAGRHAASGAPTWSYQFEETIPGRDQSGAAHTFEVPYVFGNLSDHGFMAGKYTEKHRALSAVMNAYWSNFAKTGDPNGKGLPTWPKFVPSERAFMRFAIAFPENVKADQKLRGELCGLLLVARQ